MWHRFACVWVVTGACGYDAPTSSDAAPDLPTIGFEVPDSGADEKSNIVSIEVTLSAPSDAPVSVNYAVTGGTATPGSDFTIGASQLMFAPGETVRAIPVMIVDDSDETEAVETIELELSNPQGAQLGAAKLHRVTISDHILPRVQFVTVATSTAEDAPTMLTITLDKAAEGDSTVVLGVAGAANPDFPATPGVDTTVTDGTPITITTGGTTAAIPIGEVDDPNDEEDEKLVFTLRSPSTNLVIGNLATSTHLITDNDNPPVVSFAQGSSTIGEAGGTALVDVSLSVASGKTVTVNYSFAGQSATATAADATAGTSIVFAPGETTKQIAVTIANDGVDEDNEVFELQLTSATNATVGGTATHALTITDDDDAPTVAFTAATSTKDDDDAILATVVTVALSAASERPITVVWAVNGAGTANDPGDYSISTSTTLSFPVGGGLTKSITIDVVGDSAGPKEPDQTVILDLKSATNATITSPSKHTLTITD